MPAPTRIKIEIIIRITMKSFDACFFGRWGDAEIVGVGSFAGFKGDTGTKGLTDFWVGTSLTGVAGALVNWRSVVDIF